MKKVITLFVLSTLAITICIATLVISFVMRYPSFELISALVGALLGALIQSYVGLFIDVVDYSPFNGVIKKMIRRKYITENEEFRISFAYLFKVEVNGKYFLIDDNHKFSKYKVPGGTYNITPTEEKYIREHFDLREDDKIKDRLNDYRLYLPAKQLSKFYRRFKTKIKEDIAANFLNNVVKKRDYLLEEKFKRIKKPEFIRRSFVIKYPKHFDCHELVLADIYEIKLTEGQKKFFEELMNKRKPGDPYFFATKREIVTRGQFCEERKDTELFISDHSYKILPQYSDRDSVVVER